MGLTFVAGRDVLVGGVLLQDDGADAQVVQDGLVGRREEAAGPPGRARARW